MTDQPQTTMHTGQHSEAEPSAAPSIERFSAALKLYSELILERKAMLAEQTALCDKTIRLVRLAQSIIRRTGGKPYKDTSSNIRRP